MSTGETDESKLSSSPLSPSRGIPPAPSGTVAPSDKAPLCLSLPALDRVAGHVHAAMRAARLAQYLATPGAAEPEEAAQAAERAGDAATEASAALGLLDGMGARPVASPVAEPIPLALLDTPDARELLALLRQAVPVAERLDRARGRALPAGAELLPEETHGLDLAETLSELALRLKIEVEGPTDRRQSSHARRDPGANER